MKELGDEEYNKDLAQRKKALKEMRSDSSKFGKFSDAMILWWTDPRRISKAVSERRHTKDQILDFYRDKISKEYPDEKLVQSTICQLFKEFKIESMVSQRGPKSGSKDTKLPESASKTKSQSKDKNPAVSVTINKPTAPAVTRSK